MIEIQNKEVKMTEHYYEYISLAGKENKCTEAEHSGSVIQHLKCDSYLMHLTLIRDFLSLSRIVYEI